MDLSLLAKVHECCGLSWVERWGMFLCSKSIREFSRWYPAIFLATLNSYKLELRVNSLFMGNFFPTGILLKLWNVDQLFRFIPLVSGLNSRQCLLDILWYFASYSGEAKSRSAERNYASYCMGIANSTQNISHNASFIIYNIEYFRETLFNQRFWQTIKVCFYLCCLTS